MEKKPTAPGEGGREIIHEPRLNIHISAQPPAPAAASKPPGHAEGAGGSAGAEQGRVFRGPAGTGAVASPVSAPPPSPSALVAVVVPAVSRLSPAGALPAPPSAARARSSLGEGGAAPPGPPQAGSASLPPPPRAGGSFQEVREGRRGQGSGRRGQAEAGRRGQGSCGPRKQQSPPDREQAKAASGEQPLNRRCALLNEPFT